MTALSNSEQNIVSEMATAVAKMLDSDKKNLVSDAETLTDNEGFRMWIKEGAPGLTIVLDGTGKVPQSTGGNASASQEEMWAAYRRWQDRKIINHVEADPKRPEPFWNRIKTGLWVFFSAPIVWLVPLVVVGLTVFVSFAGYWIAKGSADSAVQSARVNSYGYQYGKIYPHLTYPKDCASQNLVIGPRCESAFQQWERSGQAWIDWAPSK